MTARLRVLLVPDSIYWVTGTIAKSIATANPWIDPTIISGPLLGDMFADADEIAGRFDVVHFICPYASRDWLPVLADKVPVVTSHHHVTSWDLIRHNLNGDAIVAGSQEWVRDLESRGADTSRVFRMPYGVDVELFKPATAIQKNVMRDRLGLSAAAPVVGFFAKKASNDDDRKGTDVFVDAVMLLHRELPQAGVLIVGPGWQELVRKFRDAAIPCTWMPFIEDSRDIPSLYHALDFYWVTARVEGGPVPLLEGMSSEVCCLTTPVGLAHEVVRDGVNAVMLPMNDAPAFAAKTVELWADDERRLAMGRAARETMRNEMRAEEMAQLVGAVYEKAKESFASRNPGSHTPAARPALTRAERKKATMLEALAWSENLVLYQNQRMAAFKLIAKAWADNPSSIEPPRIFLRRFLPESVTRGVVRAKRTLRRQRT
jgi:glycosyltransferase involved in cell wall biosynthesis